MVSVVQDSGRGSDLLQRMADASGMTKQDYLINRAPCREVAVVPNKRMQRYMEESMLYVYKELRRLEHAGEMEDELTALVRVLGDTFIGLGRAGDEPAPIQSEDSMIERMVR